MGKPFSVADRAIDDVDTQTAFSQTVDDRPCCAAGTDDDGTGSGIIPTRRLIVQVRDEPISIGIAAHDGLAVKPDRIDRADGCGFRFDPVERREDGLLMRDRHVAAGKACVPQAADKTGEVFRLNVDRFVCARQVHAAQPETMQPRRA